MRVRNWKKFQHFKDRRPPWVKLYRDLLDDREWHALSGDDAKVLTMLWMLASEDSEQNGELPDAETIAFRLRISEAKIKQSLTRLERWLIQDDINVISERYQVGPPETETETETEVDHFAAFWAAYPRKEAKQSARKAFAKLKQEDQLAAIAALPTFPFSEEKQFQPHPASWLNAGRWEDEVNGTELDDDFGGLI